MEERQPDLKFQPRKLFNLKTIKEVLFVEGMFRRLMWCRLGDEKEGQINITVPYSKYNGDE